MKSIRLLVGLCASIVFFTVGVNKIQLPGDYNGFPVLVKEGDPVVTIVPLNMGAWNECPYSYDGPEVWVKVTLSEIDDFQPPYVEQSCLATTHNSNNSSSNSRASLKEVRDRANAIMEVYSNRSTRGHYDHTKNDVWRSKSGRAYLKVFVNESHRPRRASRQPRTWAERNYSKIVNYSIGDWKNLYKDFLKEGIDSHDWMFHFDLYQLKNYRAFLRTLSDYEENIVDINELSKTDSSFRKMLEFYPVEVGYVWDTSVKDFINKELSRAKRIVKDRQEELAYQRYLAKNKKIAEEEQQREAKIKREQKKAAHRKIQEHAYQEIQQLVDSDEDFRLNDATIGLDEHSDKHDVGTKNVDLQELSVFLNQPDRTINRGFYAQNFRMERRRHAMAQVLRGDNTESTVSTMEITPALIKFIESKGGDAQLYAECKGNVLQQTLHHEFVGILIDSAAISAASDVQQIDELLSLVITFADGGCINNKMGHVVDAMRFSDFCWGVLDYGCDIIQGLGDGVMDTYNMAKDPVGTLRGIGHVINLAAEHLGSFLYDIIAISAYEDLYDHPALLLSCKEDEHYQQSVERLHKKIDAIVACCKIAQQKVGEMSGHERVRGISRLVTSFYLPGKCIKGVGKFFSLAKPQVAAFVSRLKVGEQVTAAIEGMNINIAIKAADKIRRGSELIQKSVAQAIRHGGQALEPAFIQAKITAAVIKSRACDTCATLLKQSKILLKPVCLGCKRSAKVFRQKLRSGSYKFKDLFFQGKPIKASKIVLDKISYGISKTNFMKLKHLFGRFTKTSGSLNGDGIPAKLIFSKEFWHHILTGEFEVLMDSKDIITSTLSGFHFDPMAKVLKSGALKLTNITRDKATEVYKGLVRLGNGKTIEKTYFPAHWSPKKLAEKLFEASENLEEFIGTSGNRSWITGKTICGIEIEFVIEKSGELVTAYPILK